MRSSPPNQHASIGVEIRTELSDRGEQSLTVALDEARKELGSERRLVVREQAAAHPLDDVRARRQVMTEDLEADALLFVPEVVEELGVGLRREHGERRTFAPMRAAKGSSAATEAAMRCDAWLSLQGIWTASWPPGASQRESRAKTSACSSTQCSAAFEKTRSSGSAGR